MAAACGSVRKATSDRPSAARAAAKERRLCSPHATGWVTVTAAAGPPSRRATSPTTQATNRADRTSAGTATPPTTTGVSSPMRRLNSRTTRAGSDSARRWAGSPTSSVPSGARNITDATAAPAVARATVSGRASPGRHTAAAV